MNSPADIEFSIAPSDSGIVDFTLVLPDAVSPEELGLGNDNRILGISLIKATITTTGNRHDNNSPNHGRRPRRTLLAQKPQEFTKTILSLTDDGKTMIQLTVERILPLVKLEDIFIATNKTYRELVLEQIPGLPEENILCEPIGRNTAPCIGLGAIHIAQKYDDAIMFVLRRLIT